MNATVSSTNGVRSTARSRCTSVTPTSRTAPRSEQGETTFWWTGLDIHVFGETEIQQHTNAFWLALFNPDLSTASVAGKEAPLLFRAAAALRYRDTAGLLATADELQDRSFHLYAALVRVQACVLLYERGQRAEAHETALVAWHAMRTTQLPTETMLRPLVALVGLSDRE